MLTGNEEIDLFKGRDKGHIQDTKSEAVTQLAGTPPYFHDGSVAERGDAVRILSKLLLGRYLADADFSDLIAFLESLTGEVPAQFVAGPSLPAGAYKY